MTARELEIMKRELGLQRVSDPEQLQVDVEKRLTGMSAIDRAALSMRIGRKVQEAEAMSPSATYSPPSSGLVGTFVLCLLLSLGAVLLIIDTELWAFLKLIVGVMAVFWFIIACRAISRVIYRSANSRDM